MMYQMADNNLQFYIRQDYQELSSAPVITSPDLRTWVYFDALNEDGGTILPNTVNSDGSAVNTAFSGSRYVTYDSVVGKMKIDVEFPLEQNSDLPSSIQSFLEHAITDCLANGYDSLMAVFASHGGGFAGFGGDENKDAARRLLSNRGSTSSTSSSSSIVDTKGILRSSTTTTASTSAHHQYRDLLATNKDIASGIRSALDSAAGGVKLEVLGFDACLMQAVGAADDYVGVADYILASEAVEPGHGWAYNYLTTAPSALVLAKEVIVTFLENTQGSSHRTPKQLSIVDTTKFQTFIAAFEELSAELLKLLEVGDRSLHAFLSRSRASAIAFEGIADAVGSKNPSALDIGSWLEKFDDLCTPDPTDVLGVNLKSTRDAYTGMLVEQGVGPGTAAGTGMHITWPEQGEYADNVALWNTILFENANFVTETVPNFQAFLKWFLPSGSPSSAAESDTRSSICGQGAEAESGSTGSVGDTRPDDNPDILIQLDSASLNSETGNFEVEATISLDVSQMLVEYGIDLSSPFEDLLVEKGFVPEDDDYLLLLGGDVAGEYERKNYSASWDQNFYFLNISGIGTFEALYVKDIGGGSKTIPVVFFPDEKREDLAKLQYLDYLFFDFDGVWSESGALNGFLKFSVDEAEGRVNDNLALFVRNGEGNLAEQPRSAGGLILPLVEIDSSVQGRKLTTLPGGFNQTVISWSPDLDYNVLTTPAKNIFDIIPTAGNVIMTMSAFNNGNPGAEPDVRYYNVTLPKDGATKAPSPKSSPPTDAPTASPTVSPTVSPSTESPTTLGPTVTIGAPSATPTTSIPTIAPTGSPTSPPTRAPTSTPTNYTVPITGLNLTEAPNGGKNDTEQVTGNIFNHNGATTDGEITVDSAETNDENQTATLSDENSSSATIAGLSWFLLSSTVALCNLL